MPKKQKPNLPAEVLSTEPSGLDGYFPLLEALKTKVREAQLKAALSVNRELTLLYWQIGQQITKEQSVRGWGTKFIDQLAFDLKKAFPEMKGFSARNLRYMRDFAEAYPDSELLQAGPAKITWYHNTTLLDKVKDADSRKWYIAQTIENGWTRDVMVYQIESGLIERQGKAVSNFSATLPSTRSELAHQLLKNPYNFDFLSLGPETLERDLERGLLEKLRDFLLELGTGFAFVGSQYHLVVDDEDFYLDLLFYHLKIRSYIVVELKITDFKPEYAGKMGFYLSAVDEQLRQEVDGPTIGLILCKSQKKLIAEYALRNSNNPIGLSEYKIGTPLPKEMEHTLPSVEKIMDAPFWSDSPKKLFYSGDPAKKFYLRSRRTEET